MTSVNKIPMPKPKIEKPEKIEDAEAPASENIESEQESESREEL